VFVAVYLNSSNVAQRGTFIINMPLTGGLSNNTYSNVNGSSMSISFSMSSQLWMNVAITEELKGFIVGSCVVNRGRKYNYIQLHDMNI
jgi:hypothetical protein